MRQEVSTSIQESLAKLELAEQFASPVISDAAALVATLQPRCVILFGSLTRGTYNTVSDIDLVVVSEQLPDGFFDRLEVLQRLNKTRRAIDAFGYMPAEFEEMLQRGHVTALDAVADGVPLHGEGYFRQLKAMFEDMVRRGLHRTTCTWVMPDATKSR